MGAWIEILLGAVVSGAAAVAPLVGAWIEIEEAKKAGWKSGVAPLVGAWIEMLGRCHRLYLFVSLPSWERGLKFGLYKVLMLQVLSLPSWERGLK